MKMLKSIYSLLIVLLAMSLYSCKDNNTSNEVVPSSEENLLSSTVEATTSDVYVLVHGAWHPEECWHLVKKGLEKEGNAVITVQLPGLGKDETPVETVTFTHHLNAVKKAVESVSGRVILVGHSYGGTLISQVAADMPHKIKTLVYLTAFMPDNGETLFQLAQSDTSSAVTKHLQTNGVTVWVPEDKLIECFYNNVLDNNNPNLEAEVENIIPQLRPHPVATLVMPIILNDAYRALDKVYISCLKDNAITAGLQKSMYSKFPETRVITMPTTDHSPFFSKPEPLVDILKNL